MTYEPNKETTYAQSNEDLFMLNYFGDYKGNLLEIGANDGLTFSNSRLLIEHGWSAVLVEPGSVCHKLIELYLDNDKVEVYNFGIGKEHAMVKFWESGAHVPGGSDTGLVSTTNFEETKRWPDVTFTEKTIRLKPFASLRKHFPFDYISIDAEGVEWDILQQINPQEVGCKVLTIEWNGNEELLEKFTGYLKGYNLRIKNAENLIFVKDEVKVIKPKKITIPKDIKIGIGVTIPEKYNWNGWNIFSGDNVLLNRCDSQISIARDKNWLIKQFYDHGCDYIFIFDDDTFPIKEGWERFFIEASIRSGVQHFILGNDDHLNKTGGEDGLSYFQKGTGCMLFLTRKVIEEAGYMNNKYGKYGYEHAAYSFRIHKAGLTPSWYVSVDGWEEYVYSWDLQKEDAEKHKFIKVQQFTEEQKTAFIAENEFQYRKEVRSKKLYYDYDQYEIPRRKKVAYMGLCDDGSNFYRVQGVLPYIQDGMLDLCDITVLNSSSWASFAGYDVLIMPRPFDAIHADMIEQARFMGIWVIADYDDDLLNVPDHHHAYQQYHDNRNNILKCVKQADEIWVSTKTIRESLYNFNHNIHVIPNAHNDYVFPVEYKPKFKAANKKVSYRGGTTHRLDLFECSGDLALVASYYPEWEFIYIGVIDNQEFFRINKNNSNVFLTSKMPPIHYMTHLHTLNAPVMICPLETHKLNKAKSNIAWLEGTYAGSAFFGNKDIAEFDKEFIGDFSAFINCTDRYLSEEGESVLKEMHDQSWEYIKENLLLSKINQLRINRLLA